jgi:hypothetical protein
MKVKLNKVNESKNPFGGKYGIYYAVINDAQTLQFSYSKTSDRLGTLYRVEFANLVREFRSLSEVKETIKSRWDYLSEFAWETNAKKF